MTINWKVLRHALVQLLFVAALGAMTALSKADFAAFGVWGPMVAMAISGTLATITAIYNEWQKGPTS